MSKNNAGITVMSSEDLSLFVGGSIPLGGGPTTTDDRYLATLDKMRLGDNMIINALHMGFGAAIGPWGAIGQIGTINVEPYYNFNKVPTAPQP